jgi:DNA-binding transcriptional LysR family regulator
MVAQLRAFLVALEEGSLNRAALRLRMSQSALSRQMQVLENEIGGALLERTAAGVRPTDAGYALATSLPRVLAEYDAAIEEARRLARGQRDLIRIGYLGSAAQMVLDPALSALRRTHPEVKVKLLDLSPGEQIAALRKGEIDLALIGQEGALLSSEFYIRKLTTLGVVAVMPAKAQSPWSLPTSRVFPWPVSRWFHFLRPKPAGIFSSFGNEAEPRNRCVPCSMHSQSALTLRSL